MVATSGGQLLPDAAVTNLRTQLLPLTTILTPNIPEAKLILQNSGIDPPEILSVNDVVVIASKLQALGPRYVLVKGGHLPLTKGFKISTSSEDNVTVVDVLHDGTTATVFSTDFSASKNTHGTGCSLACRSLMLYRNFQHLLTANTAAIASNLAYRLPMPQAVENAIRYVEAGIRTSFSTLGQGNGPINHFHSLQIADRPPCETSVKQVMVQAEQGV